MKKSAHFAGAVILLLLTTLTGQAAGKGGNTGGIDLGPDGCTLYIAQASAVGRLNVCQNQTLPDISLAAVPDSGGALGIKALADGTVLVAVGSSIARLNSGGALVGSYDVPGNDCWSGITDDGGGFFWATGACNGKIAQFDLASGAAVKVLNGGTSLPIELAQQMFGGGTTYTTTGVQVNHGADLHCGASAQPNTLQIVWNGGNVFLLQNVTSMTCTGTPLNTISGAGTGTINGQGLATAEWTLVDGGQPGIVKDTVRLVVRNAAGEVVVEVSGKLQAGNHIAR